MKRIATRMSAALLGAALVLTPAAAWAHVTVSSPDAASGGWGKATFRVPTESETASTTSLRVTFPTDRPLASVSAQAKPGWTVKVVKSKLPKPVKTQHATLTEAVSEVVWTASGDGIAPGEFDEFSVSGGPFPEASEMTFTAEQTYSDGNVVNWDQKSDDAEHPAPVLTLAGDETDEVSDSGRDALTLSVAIAGLALGLAALVVALRKSQRRA